MTEHPITPSSELVHQWHREACRDPYNGSAFFMSKTLKYIATQAARWGWQQRDSSVTDELQKARDEELEACCEWVRSSNFIDLDGHDALRAARRPKPKSLAEEALAALEQNIVLLMPITGHEKVKRFAVIRRALERLQELEGQGDG